MSLSVDAERGAVRTPSEALALGRLRRVRAHQRSSARHSSSSTARPSANRLPFVVAFSMFGVVGALIVSRDRGTRSGACSCTGPSQPPSRSSAGEILTWLVDRRLERCARPVWVCCLGLRVAVRDPPASCSCSAAVPRWATALAPVEAVPVVHRRPRRPLRRLVFGDRPLTASSDVMRVPNPLYVEALGEITDP